MGFEDLREDMLHVHCPVCGHPALMGGDSRLTIRCEVCKNFIVVNIKDNVLTAFKSRRRTERRAVKA